MPLRSDKAITTDQPRKPLLEPQKRTNGRNNQGRLTVRHRGGGLKTHYRRIDFKRDKFGVPARLATIEYDPNRSARIGLLHYRDGEKRYMLLPHGLKVGDVVVSGPDAEARVGNALPLANIPLGTTVHNVELVPGKGGQIVRSAGTSAQVLAKEGDFATLRLPSGEMRRVPLRCIATIGRVSNLDHEDDGPPSQQRAVGHSRSDESAMTIGDLVAKTGLRMTPGDFVRAVGAVTQGVLESSAHRSADPTDEFDTATLGALRRIGADFSPFESGRPHPADVVRAAFAGLVGASATTDEVAAELHRDPSRVRQRLRDRTLWSITTSDGARLPLVQFGDDGSEIAGMGDVLASLPPDLHPVAIYRFLTTPNAALTMEDGGSMSPRDWLLSGGSAQTVVAIGRDLLVA